MNDYAGNMQQSASRVDFLIGNHFADDPFTMFRARIMVSTWVVFWIAMSSSFLMVYLLPMKEEARIGGMALTSSVWVMLTAMLASFRKSGSYSIYANLSVAVGFLAVAISVFLSKAPTSSDTLGLFYVILVLAVFFLGHRGGFFWGGLSLLVLFAFFFLELAGITFPNIYDESVLLQTNYAAMLMGLSGILGMVFIYERSNHQLKIQRDREYQRLEFLANYDELTGLANRSRFEQDAEEQINNIGVENRNEKFALLYLDLDGFKPVNDEYGHEAGDRVLATIAERIRLLLGDKGFAARHGGDEFIILLTQVESQSEAESFSQLLRDEIRQKVIFNHLELNVDASIGIAMFPKHAQDISTLIRNADFAMYHAKENRLGIVQYDVLY